MFNRVFLQSQPRNGAQGDVEIHGHGVLTHLLQHGKLVTGETGIGESLRGGSLIGGGVFLAGMSNRHGGIRFAVQRTSFGRALKAQLLKVCSRAIHAEIM